MGVLKLSPHPDQGRTVFDKPDYASFILKNKNKSGVVACPCNPSTEEAETGLVHMVSTRTAKHKRICLKQNKRNTKGGGPKLQVGGKEMREN